jgi:hypothetical protein
MGGNEEDGNALCDQTPMKPLTTFCDVEKNAV